MMKTIMYVWLNYSDRNNHIDRIALAVKNKDHLFVWLLYYLNQINYILFYFQAVLESMITNT